MSWADLLSTPEERTLPWLGGRTIFDRRRRFQIVGDLPKELGWHRFTVQGGRRARWSGEGFPDPDFSERRKLIRGYLVGDRLIPDDAAVRRDVHAVFEQSERAWLVEEGLDRFSRALCARNSDGKLIFLRQEFPEGPEFAVLAAWQDRREQIDDISGVSPALELAFLWLTWQRLLAEERREEMRLLAQMEAEEAARLLAEREHRERYAAAVGDAHARRVLAQQDFSEAARAALAVSGAELLDHRPNRGGKDEQVVQFRFQQRRFECVVHAKTLQIIDSGICLINHTTNERGDTRFTLESLPAVIDEAMRLGKLVIFRHVH